MSGVLVDSNVLLDLCTKDPQWYRWSSRMLDDWGGSNLLLINPIIYAEVSVHFASIEELDEAFPESVFVRAPLPWDAGFLAGKCFRSYRRRGGTRRSPLPDFYIGAHAAVKGLALLTRDAPRYRTYFPRLEIISPE